MSAPLGPTQVLVLLALDAVPSLESPPTAGELAEYIGRELQADRRHKVTESAVNSSLRKLDGRGLVKQLGTSFTNARCWAITGDGAVALRELARLS